MVGHTCDLRAEEVELGVASRSWGGSLAGKLFAFSSGAWGQRRKTRKRRKIKIEAGRELSQ